MAFEDDIQHNNSQMYQKNASKSYYEDDISNRLNRSSSFVDYRNSTGFLKDFKNYVKSQGKKKSSVFEEQINQSDKTHSNQQQSSRYTRSYSQINLQRKKQNSSISQQEESSSQYKHKFSLLGADDQQKSPYLKKYGNSKEDIQNQSIRKSQKQNYLNEIKTPFQNPKNIQKQNNENDIVNCLLNESNFNLNNQSVLRESNSQKTKFVFSKSINENQTQHQAVLQNSKSQNLLNDDKQLKQNQGNSNNQNDIKNIEISKNNNFQEDIIRSVQLSYNNYAKYKGDPQLQKINLQQSPQKETKSQKLSYKNTQNSQLQKQTSQVPVIRTSNQNQIIDPQSYRYLAQSRSKEKIVNNMKQSRYIDDELYTDESPIYIVNQNYEKRENLQPYFNEIIMTHSRRQNSISKNYEIQVKYRVKQEFIDQCQKQNISIKEALQSRIDYIQKDGSLAVFEQPTDESCIQSFKHTQLNKSLSPKKKKDLENILQNIEKSEESKRSSTINKNYNNNQINIDNKSQFDIEKNLTLSPNIDNKLESQTVQMNNFYTLNQFLNQDIAENKSFSGQSSITNKCSALNQIEKNLPSYQNIDTNQSSPEQKKKSSLKYFQKSSSRNNQSSMASLNIPTDSNIIQSPVSVDSANNKSTKKLSIKNKNEIIQKDKQQQKPKSQEQILEELFEKEDIFGQSQQNQQISQNNQNQQQQIQTADQTINSFRNPIFYRHSDFYIKQLNEFN